MQLDMDRIKKEMKRREWKYRDLADAMGVSRQAIYHYFRYSDDLKSSTISKISRALGVEPWEIIR